ncbi:MAG: DUF1552 domain-containing protein [Myxococcales bacterium]|nr:DUF1552 domain-containing protein [Myxococcales bacterium]
MIDRRTFLRRAGGAALALPLLQLPRGARAAETPPTRLLLFFTPNGTKKELWSPGEGATEDNWTPGRLLTPVMNHKQRLVVLDGVDNKVALDGPGGPHQRGMAGLWTGEVITEGDFVGGDGRRAGWAGGPSIDQYAARVLQPGTPLSTLELGVRVKEAVPRGRMIYRGREQPVAPLNDPVEAFDRMFGDPMAGDADATARLLMRRRSVLDAVQADFTALKKKVTAEDAAKLEQHAEVLRSLERRLGTVVDRPELCNPATPSGTMDVLSEADYGLLVRAQIDLAVNALACDVTRIASVQCSTAVNALRFTFMGLRDNEGHALSHAGDSHPERQDEWEQMLTWYSEQFAYLLDRLAAVPEGDGSLLDNTLVVWGMEISRGNNHDLTDIPFVLAGGAGGRLKGGRYLRYDGKPHNDLLVGILNLLGVPDATFGNVDYASGGPLVGLI